MIVLESFHTARLAALSAIVGVAFLASPALGAGNSSRDLAPPADAKQCVQMVKDAREMLDETEVTPEVDSQVEALIATASSQCDAAQFDSAHGALQEVRKLLGG